MQELRNSSVRDLSAWMSIFPKKSDGYVKFLGLRKGHRK